MIESFEDVETRTIFEGEAAEGRHLRKARRRLPAELWDAAQIKLDAIDAATDLRHLALPSNRLELLSGDRKGQHSIRINRRYRICFFWRKGRAHRVQIVDYHR